MLSGLFALVIAAATAALPFTPPAGWVEMPKAAVSSQISNVWKGPALPGGKHASFSIVTMPFPGSIDALATAMKAHQHAGPLAIVSNTAVQVCGSPGRMIAVKTGSGALAQTMQQEILTKNGRGYMLVYSRPAGSASDPHILVTMKKFCPSGNANVPKLTPPKGWTMSPGMDMHMVGMWMGTKPGEMMMLMRTSMALPLSKMAGRMQAGMSSAQTRKYMKLVSERQFQLCGNPAMEVEMQMNVPAFPMVMEQVLTQSNGATYILGYLHPASVSADPSAKAALQTLCASGSPQAVPSATPAPLPSLTPVPPSPSPVASPSSGSRAA